MRVTTNLVAFVSTIATSLALENNNPETWRSPNKKYAIREAFYGEGKRVVAVFVNLTTRRSTVIKGGGARNSSALWSSDSHYVAINFERSHNWGDVAICRVERGRISEVKLPSGMEPTRFLPSPAPDQILHVGPRAIRALRWLDNKRIELVSETAGWGLYRKDAPADGVSVDVEQHFIVELSGTTARIIKSYARQQMPKITTLQTRFHTLDDDKDRNDGVSETYMIDGNRVLGRNGYCQNRSWGKDLVFRNDSWGTGQEFDISGENLDLGQVGRVKYQFDMDNDDGWNVEMHVRAKCDDGQEYEVAKQLWNVANGHSRSGEMALHYP